MLSFDFSIIGAIELTSCFYEISPNWRKRSLVELFLVVGKRLSMDVWRPMMPVTWRKGA